MTQSIRAASAPVSSCDRRIAAFDHDRLVAEPAHHVLEQPALHRVIVDDEDALAHGALPNAIVPFRGTVAESH